MLGENEFLPDGYQENTMVLLVQNPAVIFAYWELSQMDNGRPWPDTATCISDCMS